MKLTINGKDYWQETHHKHVQTIREKYAMKQINKPKATQLKTITSKNGQTKSIKI